MEKNNNQTRTIHFKNGETKTISQQDLNLLKESCLLGDIGNFKILSNKEDKPFLFINLNEVTYID